MPANSCRRQRAIIPIQAAAAHFSHLVCSVMPLVPRQEILYLLFRSIRPWLLRDAAPRYKGLLFTDFESLLALLAVREALSSPAPHLATVCHGRAARTSGRWGGEWPQGRRQMVTCERGEINSTVRGKQYFFSCLFFRKCCCREKEQTKPSLERGMKTCGEGGDETRE